MNDDRNRSWPDRDPDPRRQPPPAGRQGPPPWARNQPQGGAPRTPPPGNPAQPGQPGPRVPPNRPGTPPPGFRQPPPGARRPGPPPPGPRREPELMTHHVHNGTANDRYDAGYDADGPLDPDDVYPDEPELDKKGRPVLTAAQKKKRRWKIIRRSVYAFVGVFIVIPAIAFVITYFSVDVPSPQSVASSQNQAVTYLYADGSPMGKDVPAGGNRQILTSDQIPDIMKHAAIATEDSSFETNSGFDVTGILRAVYNQVTGGTGGGSTISQQYIKKATDNDAPTLTRKWTELAKSFKMNQTYSKQDIITSYLNIIYFGRGAYGVGAASQAFFHKDVKDLSFSEAALLAGLIQQPGRSENPKVAMDRWNTALDRMVENHYITAADRKAAHFPTPVPLSEDKEDSSAPYRFISDQVRAELEAHGISSDQYYSGGYTIQTTIDKKAQDLAQQAGADALAKQSDNRLLDALVAVDPKTGGVLAYYGGPTTIDVNGQKQKARDWADTPQNPGSSMKPYDLTAFLKMGKGINSTFDGRNNREFDGRIVRNAGDSDSCSEQCTVAEAMKISANTVFYDMVLNVTKQGPVEQAAEEAGVKTKDNGGKSVISIADNNISLGGGGTQITPADQASAYATFAGDGQQRDRHFVLKVTNSQNEVAYEAQAQPAKSAFADGDADLSKQIAGNVTKALQPVIGFSKLKCPTGHECAGKTGTQQHTKRPGEPASAANANAQTWMVGYTPSVSVAVWVGGNGDLDLHGKGSTPIFGSTIAGPLWQKFMTTYLAGKPAERFPQVDLIGDAAPPSGPPSDPNIPPSDITPTDNPNDPNNPGGGDGNNPVNPGDPNGPGGPGGNFPSFPTQTPKPPKHPPSGDPTDTGDPGDTGVPSE
ncbi:MULTISPECIES: transglycosylase domain-containing protein [unclassified Amycolatopsis]|uniref:transglycosylase domain-containing protein n=1 Tax=unclassified Amycolatopsis TaxID=2618356 RepID=UPI001C6A3045|nr:transglycosylase domain-containing protein [Amycolatopsis sp. DSM 110486]QYN24099.1 penicillin-binding protein [Amycolatopsis sp. DSM 110486]